MALADEIPELPDEFLVEIGRINVRWALLESFLDLNLIHLLGKNVTEGRSLIVFNHMAFPQKIDILGAFVNELALSGYEGCEKYSQVQSLLKQAQEKRNLIIHGKFGFDPDGNVSISRIAARGKLTHSEKVVTIPDLKAISALIYQAAERLHSFVHQDIKLPRT